MRADDLNHEALLHLDAAGGLIHFAGQRALLLDAVAMGCCESTWWRTSVSRLPARC